MGIMSESHDDTTAPAPRARHRAARTVAAGLLALSGTGLVAAGADAATSPPPPSGSLANQVTSTSPGANCVTGMEPGCSTTLQVGPMAVPMADPAVAAGFSVVTGLTGLGILAIRRRAARSN
jgi:hypothetical protein